MLVGYNTNVPYKGTVYHVQTEDSGVKNPVVITLLYLKGTILSSKKVSYADLLSDPAYKDKVRGLMRDQHKAMIKELIAGKHTSVIAEAPKPESDNAAMPETAAGPVETQVEKQNESRGQISRSLDDILLDYIIKGKE
jgi:hypothetical protein